MKYEDVEKAHSLKMAIDVLREELEYFIKIRDNKAEILAISGCDLMKNRSGHWTFSGDTKNVVCDFIIKEMNSKLEKYKKELEEM